MVEKKIEFETAKLAKEKGFNYHQIMRYCSPTKEHIGVRVGRLKENEIICSNWGENNTTLFFHGEAPTQSLLQKWLREVHDIHINIGSFHCLGKEKPFSLSIDYKEDSIWTYAEFDETDFNTYEEALERGLQEGLKIIKIEEHGK